MTHEERSPSELADLAELRYVRDTEAGITREADGDGFVYVYPDGRRVRARRHVERIASLAIPPAWTDVWICRDERGHLQATGRDARDRKQYLYHERWGEISNLAKFARLHAFGRVLPSLRRNVRDVLAGEEGPDLRRTSAALVALLDRTYARIGNEEYVRANNSFGLSTLRRKHLRLEAGRARLCFTAKGGMERMFEIDDPLLVRVLALAYERPGHRLFRYRGDDGRWKDLDAEQVNDFVREATGQPFTAKDFRTWKASALVAGDLYRQRDACLQTEGAARTVAVRDAIDRAAEALGNTRAICRTYYTHPAVVDTFEDGSFIEAVDGFRPSTRKWLDRDEQVLLRLLRRFEEGDGT